MPPAKPKKSETPATERKVIYPEIAVNGVVIPRAKLRINAEKAQQILGWVEETDDVKFGPDYLVIDRNNRKVRCTNNVTNRPIYSTTLDTLEQEILNHRWQFNGETVILGKTGQVENGQHTLISVVFAEQTRTGKQSHRWQELWPEPIEIEKAVITGIEETDSVINTMDTCKPRSIADVLYRSEYFASKKPSDRRTCSRICDLAIRLLWQRTGAGADAFRRTHSEALDFLNRHPKLLACVKHIFEEDQERSISKFINGGYAAGLMYLMGSCSSDGDAYRLDRNPAPKEAALDWTNWDKAGEFWVLLSSNAPTMKEVRMSLAALVDPSTGSGGSIAEKTGVLCKAWGHFLEGHDFTEDDLNLAYSVDDDGIRHLAECPTVGGIDLGVPRESEGGDDDDTPPAPAAPVESDEDRQQRLEEQKQKILANRANGKKPPTPKKPTRKDLEAEQTAKAAEADAKPAEKPTPKPKKREKSAAK